MLNPLAILTSDVHYRLDRPVSRAEESWREVMEARLGYLRQSANDYDVPVVIAGDLFNRACPSMETVAFAMDTLTGFRNPIFCTFGQHDTPYHIAEGRHNAAYGILTRANRIRDLPVNQWFHYFNKIAIYAMPWGAYEMPEPVHGPGVKLGVMHKYVWATPDTKHTKAGPESCVTGISDYVRAFDAMVIGDNHTPWKAGNVFNHGAFLATSSDQKHLSLRLGVLWDDGSITLEPEHETAKAEWVDDAVTATYKTASGLIYDLKAIDEGRADFAETLRVVGGKAARPGTKQVIDRILEKI